MAEASLSKNPSGCYVYEILVDGVVRYIGKGRGRRLHKHLETAKRIVRRRSAGEVFWVRKFYNQLAKALTDGAQISERVIADGLSDSSAFEREAVEIAARPPGVLWNTISGGPGNSSEESLSLWKRPEYRAKQSAAKQANAEEIAQGLNRARSIRWSDPRQKAAQHERGKQKVAHLVKYYERNPHLRSEMTTARWADEAFVEKVKAGHRSRWERPGQKEKMGHAMSTVWSQPDLREQMSVTIRKIWEDPEYRRNQKEKQSARFKDPEYRKAHGERIRAAWARKKQCSTS